MLTLPAGENYRRLYGAVAPELPGLKSKLGKPGMSDVELFFRALYAVMLYRIKGDRSKQGYIDDVIIPKNTRFRIIRALEALANKKQLNPAKKHGNIPL